MAGDIPTSIQKYYFNIIGFCFCAVQVEQRQIFTNYVMLKPDSEEIILLFIGLLKNDKSLL